MFDAINGENLISTVFQEMFLSHNMDRLFGLILLHRHFDLDSSEKLVEYRGTSVPWKTSMISDDISAACWTISAHGVISPYEFTYAPRSDPDLGPNLGKPEQVAFFNAFRTLLKQHHAEGVFGLCQYPGDDFQGRVEITEGRANINLKPQDVCIYVGVLLERRANMTGHCSVQKT
ncbi:phosphotransferase enzyme family domain-containing protein [Rutstroemia sp. NJR-2017a BBW]|nr:phosphotransferase enzyme family domain-containing protein [Rutstroemia sp. NJR-2017a BBW]